MVKVLKFNQLLGLAFCIVLCSAAVAQLSQPSVQLTTTPPIAQIIPLEAAASSYLGSGQLQIPTTIVLQANEALEKPLTQTHFHVQLLTPPPTPWFTTDFPIVEGTELLDIEANSESGRFQFQQMFPIRGSYQLKVAMTPIVAGAFKPINQLSTLTVRENPLKLIYFPILLLILVAIGLIGGWTIGGRQSLQPGEIAPQKVRLLLSGLVIVAIGTLLYFNITAELVDAQGHHHDYGDVAVDNSGMIQSQGLTLALAGEDQTSVGQLASFQATLMDDKTKKPVEAVFSIESVQLEDNWVAFAYQGRSDSQGLLTWNEQFFDASPHKISLNVSPIPAGNRQFKPFRVTRDIDVEGVEPPIGIRLIGLAYFTAVVVVGLVLGLLLQRRRSLRV
jgi:hypothetical protein